jgi:hypothetical protein
MRNKTLEELENDIWQEPNEFPTGLIERCFKYRKIRISELSVGQLRTLISQKIGIKYLTEIALELLENNIVIGDLFEGDLLLAVSKIPSEYWNHNRNELKKLKILIESNTELIKSELGENDYVEIIDRIKPVYNNV